MSENETETPESVIRDIGYPFKAILLDVGRGIENVDMKDISPFTIVALTAMKYICAKAFFVFVTSLIQFTEI